MQPLVLIVDDDAHIREVVRFALAAAGLRTVEAADGHEALERFGEAGPDLVILDVMLPGMDGVEVCRRLRARGRVPIVFLSSRDDEVDRVVGLEIGGDDYVTKPFSPRELVARVRAVLRRVETSATPPASATPLRHGRLELDEERFRVTWDAREIVLTATEFGILRTLLGRPEKVFSRAELMDGAYAEANVVSDRTIDSHVRRVRQKLGQVDPDADPIETVHGVGYRLAALRRS